MDSFDARRAHLNSPDSFPRFSVPDRGAPLRDAHLSPDTELLVAERGGERRAFVMSELSQPHLAQGKLGGEPYLVSF